MKSVIGSIFGFSVMYSIKKNYYLHSVKKVNKSFGLFLYCLGILVGHYVGKYIRIL